MKQLIITILLLSSLLSASSVEDQLEKDLWNEIYNPPYTVPTEITNGSQLRALLFDKLRMPIVKRAKSEVKFAGTVRVYQNWAFFLGSSFDSNGKRITYPPMQESDIVALWLHTVNGWVVVDYEVGITDTFYSIWHKRYGVSREVMGLK